MNTAKGPTTAEVPDWERLFDELLEHQSRMLRMAATLRAIGRDPTELMEDLLQLGVHLKYVDQMRRITSCHDFSDAA